VNDSHTFRIQLTNNKTTCISSCCVPKVKQINGAQGEATGTDDLRRPDRQQNRRLSKLEQKLASLSLKNKKTPKKKRRQPNTRRSRDNQNNPFPGLPQPTPTATPTVIAHRDPLVHNIVAQFNPFRVPRGVASGLTDARPSQKITSRGVMSVTVPASTIGLMCACPSIASDAVCGSARIFMGTTAALATQLLSATSLASGVTSTYVVTNTPYTADQLAGKDFQWRLVSAGLRVRNVTAAVNRQGILQGFFDLEHTLFNYDDGSVNLNQIVTLLGSNHRTLRINMAGKPDTEFPMSSTAHSVNYWNEQVAVPTPTGNAISYYAFGNYLQNVAGYYGAWGGQYVVFPSVGSAQSYEVELVEHWEVHGSTIETLHTPSASHTMAEEVVSSIIKQTHHQHSLTPEVRSMMWPKEYPLPNTTKLP